MPTTTGEIQLRRGTAAQWTSDNPVLGAGEPGYETDSRLLKLGDGATPWNALKYWGIGQVDNAGLAGQFLEKVADGAQWTSLSIGSFFNVTSDTPEAHGAKRDGKTIIDATISADALGVVSSASGGFVNARAGMAIMLNYAGSHGSHNVHITTIQSVTSASSVTLTDPAVHAIADQAACFGTDDTAAIKAAIANAVATAQANGSFFGEVLFSAGMYIVAGALDTSQHGNSQIPLPYQSPTGQKFTLVLRGTDENSALTHWTQPYPQQTGAVLVSVRYPPNNDLVHGPPSVIGGPVGEQGYGGANNGLFSNMLVTVQGLTLTLPLDHTQIGFNFYGVAEANVPNASVFSFGTVVNGDWVTRPTAGYLYSGSWFACGLVMPSLGNNDQSNIGYYSAEGLCGGLAMGEHTHADSVRIISCNIGVTGVSDWQGGSVSWGGDHSTDISYLSIEDTRVHIYALSITLYPWVLNVWNYDPELADLWHIYAAQNMRGTINVTTVMAQGLKVNWDTILGPKIVDASKHPGKVEAAGMPAVPATDTPTQPTYYGDRLWRDVAIAVSGAGLTGFAIDGVAEPYAAGLHIVPAGSTYTLSYSGASSGINMAWTIL